MNFVNNGFIFTSLINPPNTVTQLASKVKGQLAMEQYSFNFVCFSVILEISITFTLSLWCSIMKIGQTSRKNEFQKAK